MQLFYMRFHRHIKIPTRKLIATIHADTLSNSECRKCLLSNQVKCSKESSQCNKFNITISNISSFVDTYGIGEDDNHFFSKEKHILKDIESSIDLLFTDIYGIDEDDDHFSPQEKELDFSQIPDQHIWTDIGRDVDRLLNVKNIIATCSPDELNHLFCFIKDRLES